MPPAAFQQQARNAVSRASTCIRNIMAKNPKMNGFVYLRNTDAISEECKNPKNYGRDRPLAGRLVGLKDNFCTVDMPTTCASKMLQDYTSPYESTPSQLLRDAGAVFVGKANMDEFAMGTHNLHSIYGKCLNPLFPLEDEVSPGGSSGGSAAVVAADMCDIALGSDTGGSVRLPAAYCGVVGYKPSYGLISRHGVIAYAQSLDTVGIVAKNVADVETTFNVLNHYDDKDPTSLAPEFRKRIQAMKASRNVEKLRIGIVQEAIIDLSPQVREAWINSLEYMRGLGHEVVVVSVPSLRNSLPTYFIVSPAEASSNLARYDGVRYGYRHEEDRDGDNLYAPTKTEGFGSEVQRRILLGTYNLSAGAYGNHYEKAQKVRRCIQKEFDDIFSIPNVLHDSSANVDCNGASSVAVDVLIQPTTRTIAPTFKQVSEAKNATDAYVNDVLTVPANLAGLPAISVPWGHGTDSVGIQVIGQFGDDQLVLDVAKILETANKL